VVEARVARSSSQASRLPVGDLVASPAGSRLAVWDLLHGLNNGGLALLIFESQGTNLLIKTSLI
jgi:hypothetical protein